MEKEKITELYISHKDSKEYPTMGCSVIFRTCEHKCDGCGKVKPLIYCDNSDGQKRGVQACLACIKQLFNYTYKNVTWRKKYDR